MNDASAQWLLLAASLPGSSASTARVRLWRSLRDLGAATLRDGVTLLPASEPHEAALDELAEQVTSAGGAAWLLSLVPQQAPTEGALTALFDRTEAYRTFLDKLAVISRSLPMLDEAQARRQFRQVERELGEIRRIDFFPGEPGAQAELALQGIASEINQRFSPAEPSADTIGIELRDVRAYRGRYWATRRGIWVDRVASAWLIHRFIDPDARFLWLERPGDCPPEALGFDFDGAAFTHVGDRVTFEVLRESFALGQDPGLEHLGGLIHYLDVGGIPVAEAAGFEAVLAGLRESCPDDDALLDAMTPVLDALHRRFSAGANGRSPI